MLKIFKDHVSKTSILDDFAFYESRQKLMQDKRSKQQQVQKQVHLKFRIHAFIYQLQISSPCPSNACGLTVLNHPGLGQ
jgi:hypothetical protein